MTNESKLLIAICTYNEINNLPSLYEALRTHFPDASMLVVDDNSPDGTGVWCDDRKSKDARFHVIHRESKAGLGSASIAAFQFAIDRNFEFVLTMDGDWSHHPGQAKTVFQKLIDQPESELSIGSRYVKGGKIKGWPWKRHMMSFCINTFSRWMIGLKTRDCSGAFRCYRRSFLERVNFQEIQGTGYAYLEEILWWAKRLSVKIIESPITFTNRQQGKSKINMKEAVRAVWIIFKIGIKRLFGRGKIPASSE